MNVGALFGLMMAGGVAVAFILGDSIKGSGYIGGALWVGGALGAVAYSFL